MHPDSKVSSGGAALAGNDVMHVEESSTPDGRLLLYFTFVPSQAILTGQQGDAGAADDRRRPVAGGLSDV